MNNYSIYKTALDKYGESFKSILAIMPTEIIEKYNGMNYMNGKMELEKLLKSQKEDEEQELIVSLDRIAICLPGGGFRAAAFSLGILDFLNEANLLPNLKSLSSVSGGTITAARYAYSIARNETYNEFHNSLYTWLKNNKLLPSALKKLNGWKSFGHKRKNLINAFALEYNDFMSMTFEELENQLNNSKTLDHVIFNATEFSNGLQFRFASGGFRFGNGSRNFAELKPYIKLGDIIAASSCFPIGFEPISFPDDFVPTNQLKKIKKHNPSKDYEPIGLMDGGILDNLGVLSHLTGDEDRGIYTTFIVGNAGKSEMKSFTFTEDSNKWNKYISWIFSWWTFIASFLFIIAAFKFDLKYFLQPISSVLFIVLAVVQAIFFFIISYGKRTLNLKTQLKLPRSQLGIFILDRLKSAIAMNTSVFLKGAKSSNMTRFYDRYELKVCESQISLFDGTIYYEEELAMLGVTVSDTTMDLSKLCSNMDTTLWFTDNHIDTDILDKLILSGKLSTCYALMQQQVRIKGDDFLSLDTDSTFHMLRNQWHKLERSPLLARVALA